MINNGIALCVLELIHLSSLDHTTTKPLEYVKERTVATMQYVQNRASKVKPPVQANFKNLIDVKIIQVLQEELGINVNFVEDELKVVIDPIAEPSENFIGKDNKPEQLPANHPPMHKAVTVLQDSEV